MGAHERSKRILDLAQRIEDDLERFARAESVDTGKPIDAGAIGGHPPRGRELPVLRDRDPPHGDRDAPHGRDAHGGDRAELHHPFAAGRRGAHLALEPALYLLTWKIAPAIATGNTCVAKPSEVTPATAHLMGEAIAESSIPDGVINIVHGLGDECGAAIVEHPM